MSAENVAVIKGIYHAFAAGDVAGVLGRMSPDIVWHEAENFPYADKNPYHGPEAVAAVADHFTAAGLTTQRMSSFESLELAKLLETTYFGVLVAWAQEMDRFAGAADADYWETTGFFEEIGFFPPVSFEPGFIGGHCVMPNLDLLEQVRRSPVIDVIRQSNERRAHEWQTAGRSTAERLSPRPRGA